MGLLKFILQSLPGTPGKTAKVFIEEYNKLRHSDSKITQKEIQTILFGQRISTWQKLVIIDKTLLPAMDEKSFEIVYREPSFSCFIFKMMFIESPQFRKGARNDATFKLALEIIVESVNKYSFEKDDSFNLLPSSTIHLLKEWVNVWKYYDRI
jgi:hypothetical protein